MKYEVEVVQRRYFWSKRRAKVKPTRLPWNGASNWSQQNDAVVEGKGGILVEGVIQLPPD